jgi:histidine ammonia-lyase
VEKVLAIELLTAVQAIEFRRPLKTSKQLEEIIVEFRKIVSFNESDRILHDDMMKAVAFISNYSLK